MKASHPKYAFSPSLLDAFERMISTKAEDYFYQDDEGAWHKNYNETTGEFHFSEEEVDALLRQEFIDRVNKKPTPPSEAASKGTALNEIVDCLVHRGCHRTGMVIKTVRDSGDLFVAKKFNEFNNDSAGLTTAEYSTQGCDETFAKIGKPFIYAGVDGFEFFFDIDFAKSVGSYFAKSLTQHYCKTNLQTCHGIVELHGYIDYLRENKVYDLKTTKQYTFGDYERRWQRFAYPYALIESGEMDEVSEFEFTIYKLKGGTSATPLITGEQYKEVYTYNHKDAEEQLRNHCECLIDFLEANRSEITNLKVFGG